MFLHPALSSLWSRQSYRCRPNKDEKQTMPAIFFCRASVCPFPLEIEHLEDRDYGSTSAPTAHGTPPSRSARRCAHIAPDSGLRVCLTLSVDPDRQGQAPRQTGFPLWVWITKKESNEAQFWNWEWDNKIRPVISRDWLQSRGSERREHLSEREIRLLSVYQRLPLLNHECHRLFREEGLPAVLSVPYCFLLLPDAHLTHPGVLTPVALAVENPTVVFVYQ